MGTSSELLADRLLAMPDRLPREVETLARMHVVDAVGVGMAAARVGPVRHLAARGVSAIPGARCTVLGSEGTYSAPDAALVNGTLIHSLEFDDTHTGSVMHGSSVLAPAVLAAAQDVGADGRALLTSFVAGWETIIRLGLAAPSGFQRAGFQGTSVAGTIAGAAAVALTQGFGRAELVHCIGIAASFSAGNFTFLSEGASVKAAQAGIAAQGAVSASRLARGGVTAGSRVFEDEGGFFGLYARDATANERFQAELATLGSTWLIGDAAFKEFPCCHFIHPFIEAVRDAGLDAGAAPDIAEIRCRVPSGQENVIAVPWERRQAPASAGEGRWSLPYVLALQILTGDVAIEDFAGDPDQEVVAMAKRMTWEIWEGSGYPHTFPGEIEVVRRDGSRRTVHVADVNGNRTRPWSEAQVAAKFRRNAELAGLAEKDAERILQTLLADDEVDLTVLADVMR